MSAAPARVALAVVLALVAAAALANAGRSSFAPRAGHQHDAHHHPRLLTNGDAAAGEDGFPTRKNGNGQPGSGGRAVAHHAGGIAISSRAATAAAPDARIYRLGINGWEPTIGVDSKSRIFYQARNANLEPQVMRSTNDGHTWRIVSPTIAGRPAQPISLDPILYLDKDTDRVFTNNIPPDITCQPISFSDNGGKAWTNTGICGHFDHQNIFTGPPATSETSGYPNLVYYCAINLVALSGTSTATTCSKSLDGGLTWLHTGEPAFLTPIPPESSDRPICDGGIGHGFVDEKGTVYVPRVWCGRPYLAVSHDEGFSWERLQVAKNGGVGHEAGVAVDDGGAIYFTWIAKDRLPYLAVSRDGGRTWADPMMVGPPGLKRSSLAAIDVGGPGKVAITYAGSESPGDARKNWTWNGYITMTDDALDKAPVFYSGTMNHPRDPLSRGSCGVVRCHTLGDFFDVTIGPDGTPWVAFVDACAKPNDCIETFEAVGVRGESVVGRLVGGPSLR
ncbi:MAG: sialidase family protein [Actinomycetota bacterium]